MPRILVIEDDENMRSLIRRALSRAGHELLEAADGRAGLQVIAQEKVDLIITDIIMPEMEGIEFIRGVHRERGDFPIIAISGGGRVGPDLCLELAKALGARKVLKKPFGIGDLLQAVAEVTKPS